MTKYANEIELGANSPLLKIAKKRTRGVPREHMAQVEVFRWAADPANLARWPELALLHAIPNAGGYRGGFKANVARVAWMKAEGVKPGVPDIHLPVGRAGWFSLYIEMKAEDGTLTEEQREWSRRLRACHHCAVVAVGADEAINHIMRYLDSFHTTVTAP